MKIVFPGMRSWCEDIETGAMAQALNAINHPVVDHVALMPDCHQGYGVPIGSVLACKDAVIPNAVGVDIGCGMCAVNTGVPADEVMAPDIEDIIKDIARHIPVGFARHEEKQSWAGFMDAPYQGVVGDELDAAHYQLGTLGGGNHFIELQAGDDNYLWVMIHSGSRNIGYKIATHYHELADEMCAKWHSALPKTDLAFLPVDSEEGQRYIKAMQFAQDFAAANREHMMSKVEEILGYHLGAEVDAAINIHHNFAALEHHFGHDYWIHRKGATQAKEGQFGIIPGSMGTSSYIVRGLGNLVSMTSCSHGAGRRMGRMAFNRQTTEEEVNKSIEGVAFAGWGKDRKGKPDWSEAPGAYKDIDEVMAAQSDLVEIRVKLRPLGVVKG